jgi:hypothetical protein
MTNPTTYFGWQMPEPTDLVTDLPADFEVFGQAVDTDLQDLLGGTTGQVLSKTSGTDLDFTWVDPTAGDITGVTAGTGISGGGTSGTVTVTNSMATAIDAKGDLIAGTADDTFDRLAVGANDTILTADSSTATGLKWAAPADGGKILQVVSTTDNTLKQVASGSEYTEIATAITPSSASSRILVLVSIGLSSNSTNADSGYRIKRDSTAIQQGSGGTVNINASFYMGEGSSEGRGQTIQLIDSPSTTSAITYKMELLSNTGTININRRGLDTYFAASSSMTLMEIGA